MAMVPRLAARDRVRLRSFGGKPFEKAYRKVTPEPAEIFAAKPRGPASAETGRRRAGPSNSHQPAASSAAVLPACTLSDSSVLIWAVPALSSSLATPAAPRTASVAAAAAYFRWLPASPRVLLRLSAAFGVFIGFS